MDGEVGDRGFDLQSSGGSDGAAADMDLNAHIVDLSHITDLLGFGDAAGVAQIRLDHGQGAVLEELPEAPTSVAALTRCQRQVAFLLDVAEVAGVLGAGGFLKVHDVQWLQSLAQLSGGVGVQQRVDLNDDVHIGAAGLTAGCNALYRALQVVLAIAAANLSALAAPDLFERGVGIGGSKDGVYLDGIVAVAEGVFGHFVVILRVEQQAESLALVIFLDQVAPAKLQLRSVCAELRIGLAAQQLVDGNAEGFALDIPAGGIDGSHSRGDDNTAAHAPESVAMQVLPDLLRIKRVHADDQLGKILALTKCCFKAVAVCQTGFAPAVNAFVSVNLHSDELAQITLNTRDFHNRCSFPKSGLW